MITPKLEFEKKTLEKRYSKKCDYCQKDGVTNVVCIYSSNRDIHKLFCFDIYKVRKIAFWICEDCFEKLHPILEEIEADGWSQLDWDSGEFEGLDEEIEEQKNDGLGT